MAKIKEVVVETIIYNPWCKYHAWTSRRFKTFTDDNGNKTYYVDGKEVSKEDGNKIYLSMKNENANYQKSDKCKEFIKREKTRYNKCSKDYREKNADYFTLNAVDTFKQTVNEYEISYEEIIERLKKSIDQYVEYIDDGAQYRAACEHNRKIAEEIDRMEELIAERR